MLTCTGLDSIPHQGQRITDADVVIDHAVGTTEQSVLRR